MEHPCPKCGEAVEDGIPFCRACRAPQIRVPGFEPAVTIPSHAAEVADTFLPAAQDSQVGTDGGVQWSKALPCAVVGAALTILLAQVPLALLGPAYVAGGALSVWLYRYRAPKSVLSPMAGGLIGASSGGFAFLFVAIRGIATVVYHTDDVRQTMIDSINQASTRGYDPQTIQQAIESLKSPDGLAMVVTLLMAVGFMILTVGASIGGAWYAAWDRKRSRH